jgi:adenine/guanine/hypoxanthine permease
VQAIWTRFSCQPPLAGGWGQPDNVSGIGFNSCTMFFGGPPYSVVCPWMAVGGLILTSILMIWNINGAFIIGIFFTMFVSWIKFPGKLDDPESEW